MSTPFNAHEGAVALIPQDDVNTDVIIPMDSALWVARADLGTHAFSAMRWRADGTPDPTFGLNAPFPDPPSVLLVGVNFGCGSSREAAVHAIEALGIRALLGTTYGDIFYSNCVKNGILPARLDAEDHAALLQRLEALPLDQRRVSLDLGTRTLAVADGHTLPFTVGEAERERLLAGADEIDITLAQAPAIEQFRQQDRQRRPWAWPSDWR